MCNATTHGLSEKKSGKEVGEGGTRKEKVKPRTSGALTILASIQEEAGRFSMECRGSWKRLAFEYGSAAHEY